MYKHILIPTDGSRLSNAAVLRGIQLASAIHARVTVLGGETNKGLTHSSIPVMVCR